MCTLRDDFHDAARMRVRQWVNAYAKKQGLVKYQGEQINKASRTTVDKNYFGQMYRAKIVVTVNPGGWEGDFRFMEAVSSGALIFVGECRQLVTELMCESTNGMGWNGMGCGCHVMYDVNDLHDADHMYAPRPHPLLDGKHVVYYDNDNKTDLFVKLDYYRQNMKKARVVAINGYLHAMKHHRSACLVDYVMRSVQLKLDQRQQTDSEQSKEVFAKGSHLTSAPAYTETGFHMHSIARKFDKAYKEVSKLSGQKTKLRLLQSEYDN